MEFCTLKTDESQVDFEKVSLLDDIITFLPQIISKSKNVSDGMHDILMTSKTSDFKKLSKNSIKNLGKHNSKRREQLVELISVAIKSKHQQLSRAFREFDQHNRMRVSLNDFIQALEGLNVRISNDDAKQVFDFLDTKNFKYLTLEQFSVLYDCQKGILNTMNEE